MRSKIHIIRHGTTEGNKKGWYYGDLDIPLLEEGIKDIEAKKAGGVYPEVSGGFFTSGMTRTNQTLDLIYGKVERTHILELSELKFGIFEGKTYDEIKDQKEFNDWIYDEEGNIHVPGGDSRNSFRERVMKGLDKLISLHRLEELKYRHVEKEAESICVCHGGVIGCIMNEVFNDEKDFLSWIPNQGEGYTLILDNGIIVDFEELGGRYAN